MHAVIVLATKHCASLNPETIYCVLLFSGISIRPLSLFSQFFPLSPLSLSLSLSLISLPIFLPLSLISLQDHTLHPLPGRVGPGTAGVSDELPDHGL